MPPNPVTGKVALIARETGEQIVKLRVAGLNYREISKQVQLTPRQCRAHVLRYVERVTQRAMDSAEVLRTMTIERLNEDLSRLRQASGIGSLQPKADIVGRYLNVHDRLMRLQGLEAPIKVDVNVGVLDTAGAKIALALMEFVPDHLKPVAAQRVRAVIDQHKAALAATSSGLIAGHQRRQLAAEPT